MKLNQIEQQQYQIKENQIIYQNNDKIIQQYQNQPQKKIQNQPQYYQNVQTKNYIPQPQPQITQKQIKDPKQIVAQDKPLIESQFMPEFQLPNSVIKQSQIPIIDSSSGLSL